MSSVCAVQRKCLHPSKQCTFLMSTLDFYLLTECWQAQSLRTRVTSLFSQQVLPIVHIVSFIYLCMMQYLVRRPQSARIVGDSAHRHFQPSRCRWVVSCHTLIPHITEVHDKVPAFGTGQAKAWSAETARSALRSPLESAEPTGC